MLPLLILINPSLSYRRFNTLIYDVTKIMVLDDENKPTSSYVATYIPTISGYHSSTTEARKPKQSNNNFKYFIIAPFYSIGISTLAVIIICILYNFFFLDKRRYKYYKKMVLKEKIKKVCNEK